MKQIVVNNISTTYFITEDGKCYNNKTGKYLKGQIGKNGYLSFSLTLPDGSKKRVYAHRLVALNYLPTPKKGNIEVDHVDGNKLNNHYSNLEWVSSKENQQRALKLELRKFNHIYCFDKNKRLVAEYINVADAAKAVNISKSIIMQEINKEIKTLSGGFYWSKEKILGQTKNYENLGKAKEVYQYDLNNKFIMAYPSTGAAARALGLSSGSHIGECCRGKIKTFKGFIWRYSEDIVLTFVKAEETVSKTEKNKKESEWSGDAENAYFSMERFDKYRVLLQPEYEYSGRSNKNAYYVIGVDVGRKGCTSEAAVIKVTPQVEGTSLKSLVNIYTYVEEHFGIQAIHLKKLYYKYKAKALVIDANGIGAGLIDFMVTDQEDPETGEFLPNFGVGGATYEGWEKDYKRFKNNNTEENAMFLIKANAPINTEAHSYVQTQLSSGKIRFLIDESQAKVKLLGTKIGQSMTPEKRNEYLKPFVETTILREQLLNLVEDNEGINIILKMVNRSVGKDKFSAFEYALYYIKQEEDNRKRKRGRKISDFLFFS